MRNEKALITVLKSLVDLLGEEANKNPAFAERLDEILQNLRPIGPKNVPTRSTEPPMFPDIHDELSRRGEPEFRLWLRDLPLPVLRGIIRAQDFDPTRRTSKWKDAEKLADFIAGSLRARVSRGTAFLERGVGE